MYYRTDSQIEGRTRERGALGERAKKSGTQEKRRNHREMRIKRYKLACVLLALVMVFSVTPMSVFAADDATTSGTNNVTTESQEASGAKASDTNGQSSAQDVSSSKSDSDQGNAETGSGDAGDTNSEAVGSAEGEAEDGEEDQDTEDDNGIEGVAAYKGTGYESLSEAVAAAVANGGGTVKLLKDTTDSVTVDKEINLNIDLNGKTLTATSGKIAIFLKNGVTGVIKNGTITGGESKDGSAIYSSYSSVSLDSVKITGNNSKFSGYYAVVYSFSQGDQSIKNCDFVNNTQGALKLHTASGGTIEVSNCNFKDNVPSAAQTTILSSAGVGSTTFNNCTISGNKNTASVVSLGRTTTMKNCKITGNTGHGINIGSSGTANFENTEVTNNTSPSSSIYSTGGITVGNKANFTMTGGALYGNTYNSGSSKGDICVYSNAIVSVDSAVSKGSGDTWYDALGIKAYDSIDMTASAVMLLYATKYDELPGVASIGDKSYLNLDDAMEAAKAGDTIKILPVDENTTRTITTSTQINWPDGVTLDLNGNKYVGNNWFCVWEGDISVINSADGYAEFAAFVYVADGNFTVGDRVNATRLISYNGGNVTLSGAHKSLNVTLKDRSLHLNATEDFTATSVTLEYSDDTLDKYNDVDADLEDLVLIKGQSEINEENVIVSGLTNKLAEIMINDDGDVVLHKGGTVKAIYVDGVNGSDDNDGLAADTALKTFAKAKETLFKIQEEDGGYRAIYVVNTITVDSEETFDLGNEGNMLVRYPENKKALINVNSGGDLTLKNLTINGNKAEVTGVDSLINIQKGGNVTIEDGAVLTSNDVTPKNYPAYVGGAITVKDKGASLTMNGGIIRKCVANNGGAVFVRGEFTMNGGLIEKNQAKRYGTDYKYGCGGGVCIDTYGNMDLKGGTFRNNTAYDGGAIGVGAEFVLDYDAPTLTMTGGTLTNNTASNCGGGIFVQCNSTATVSGGNITNNTANGAYAHYTGGGIYVNGGYTSLNFNNGVLYLTNAIIAENDATSAGSGVASCPTSTFKMYVNDGAAIIDNEDDEFYMSNVREDGLTTHAGNPTLYLASRMLGGSAYNWSTTGSSMDVDFDSILNTESTVKGIIDLDNDPDGDYRASAEKYAKVYITGNSAETYGGGIGSNGDVIIGTNSLTYLDVSGTKSWDFANKTSDDNSGEGFGAEELKTMSITVNLYANGTLIETKDVNATDGWEYEFTNLPKEIDGEEIEYTTSEDAVSNYDSSYEGYDITNTYVENKVAVSVTKEWDDEDNKDGSRPDSITVRLYADGEDTGNTLTLTADDGWKGSFTDLAEKTKAGKVITYTISEDEITGYETKIAGDMEEGFVITNYHTPDKPCEPSDSDDPDQPDEPDEPSDNPPDSDNPKDSSSSKTGDNMNLVIWIIIGLAAVSGGASVIVYRRRQRN